MATNPPAEFHPYKITSQEKTQTFTADGRFQNVWRVGFEDTENGYHAYIEVPEAQYDPATVEQMIQAELDKISGVHELGESPHEENKPAAEGGPPEAGE